MNNMYCNSVFRSESDMKIFLAANSAEGFISHFGDCYDPADGWKAFIIKGGPGTGKSSFMKKVREKALKNNIVVDEIYCASDPSSLDGLILPEKKTVIMDGTSPHVVEPRLPGVCECILDFGSFWDSRILEKERDIILSLTKENKKLHKNASRYIKAAGEVMLVELFRGKRDTRQSSEDFKSIPTVGQEGKRRNFFLGGITPQGIKYFKNFSAEDTIYTDKAELLSLLAKTAQERGHEVIVFKNPVLPGLLTDGVYIPSLSLFAAKENPLPKEGLAFELLKLASKEIEKAKILHDQLESFYISAMDFEKLNTYCDKVLTEIL